MGMAFKDYVEILSDLSGAVSAVALLIPTYSILRTREALRTKIASLMAKAAGSNVKTDDLVKEHIDADAATSQLDPRDARLIKIGMWALLASFAFKLLYHFLSKSA